MITIYQYDRDGYFLDQKQVDPKSAIPVGWTHKEPTHQTGERFAGGAWVIQEIDFEPIKQQIWEDIKAIRQRKITEGGYKASGKWFHSDVTTRSQQIGLMLMGDNIPPDLMWKSMDGSFVQMTQQLAMEIFNAAAASDRDHFEYAEFLWQQVEQATDPRDVDIEQGWPTVYQDVADDPAEEPEAPSEPEE